MTPYSSERPCGRLVETATGHRIEWFEKAADEPQPIRFQKDDDDTAISGKKQAKDSLKRAKKQRKDRLKAEAAAEAARAELNKGGAEMDKVITIAKANPRALTKREWFLELQKRADAQRQPGETREVAFSKYATGTEDGRVLMAAHKVAGGEDWAGEDADEVDEPATSSSYDALMRLASQKRKKDETVEQAFARLFADPKYAALVKRDRAQHFERVAKAMSAGR